MGIIGGDFLKTVGGVYYNLKESTYNLNSSGLTFYFSSNLYKNMFIRDKNKHRLYIHQILKNKIGLNADFNRIADISLYRKIEKRGFYILNDRGEEVWPKIAIFDGEKKILNEYEKPLKGSMQK
jgi:hypothetical protein|uniref:Transcriptional regulator n=1 Tax=Podoviridae sp. ctC8s18 TaxID=2827617 RepID=A0A8S5LQV9_9CAUD|nr:MAG TPA: transcriptional regulator [Podoviridae sp. ctC8s18]